MTLSDIYTELLNTYGPQGWWPIHGYDGENPTKSGSVRGYHPGDYSFPRTSQEQYEICVGAILTQNTAWPNVEQALARLDALAALEADGLRRLSRHQLTEAIRPSGYFNVKARKLIAFTDFHDALAGAVPSRQALLNVWGIGPETADSILLYAYRQPELVVDAYTRRILAHLGYVADNCCYGELKRQCCARLPIKVTVYQEFHALMVEHGKRHYRKRPCTDPLLSRLSNANFAHAPKSEQKSVRAKAEHM